MSVFGGKHFFFFLEKIGLFSAKKSLNFVTVKTRIGFEFC